MQQCFTNMLGAEYSGRFDKVELLIIKTQIDTASKLTLM